MKKLVSAFLALIFVFTLISPAAAADSASGATLRLEKAEGTVTITKSSGSAVTVKSDMRLLSGYSVKTGAASYAYISLDDTKAVKLDASSEVSIDKSGKKLEINLVSGALFFDVSKPLEGDEQLNIKTSTMITGVRGTSGVVRVKPLRRVQNTTLALFDGLVLATTFPNGAKLDTLIEAGKELDAVAETTREITVEDIPGFAAVEIASDPELQERVAETFGEETTQEIVSGAEERLASDEAKAEETAQELETVLDEQKDEQQKIDEEGGVSESGSKEDIQVFEDEPATTGIGGGGSTGGGGGGSDPGNDSETTEFTVMHLNDADDQEHSFIYAYKQAVTTPGTNYTITISPDADNMPADEITASLDAEEDLPRDLAIPSNLTLQSAAAFKPDRILITGGTLGGTLNNRRTEITIDEGSLLADAATEQNPDLGFTVNSISVFSEDTPATISGSVKATSVTVTQNAKLSISSGAKINDFGATSSFTVIDGATLSNSGSIYTGSFSSANANITQSSGAFIRAVNVGSANENSISLAAGNTLSNGGGISGIPTITAAGNNAKIENSGSISGVTTLKAEGGAELLNSKEITAETLRVRDATLKNIGSDATLSVGQATVEISNSGAFENSGTLRTDNSVQDGHVTVTLSGSGNTMTNSGTLPGVESLTVSNDAAFTNAGSISVGSFVVTDATFNNNSGSINITGSDGGSITLDSSASSNTNAHAFTNAGTINASAPLDITISGSNNSMTNSGNLPSVSGLTTSGGATLTNRDGTISADTFMAENSTITNSSGTIEADSGEIILSGDSAHEFINGGRIQPKESGSFILSLSGSGNNATNRDSGTLQGVEISVSEGAKLESHGIINIPNSEDGITASSGAVLDFEGGTITLQRMSVTNGSQFTNASTINASNTFNVENSAFENKSAGSVRAEYAEITLNGSTTTWFKNSGNITSESEGGVNVSLQYAFNNMTNSGNISNAHVSLDNGSTLTMTGGTIDGEGDGTLILGSENQATGGKLVMTGGSIENSSFCAIKAKNCKTAFSTGTSEAVIPIVISGGSVSSTENYAISAESCDIAISGGANISSGGAGGVISATGSTVSMQGGKVESSFEGDPNAQAAPVGMVINLTGNSESAPCTLTMTGGTVSSSYLNGVILDGYSSIDMSGGEVSVGENGLSSAAIMTSSDNATVHLSGNATVESYSSMSTIAISRTSTGGTNSETPLYIDGSAEVSNSFSGADAMAYAIGISYCNVGIDGGKISSTKGNAITVLGGNNNYVSISGGEISSTNANAIDVTEYGNGWKIYHNGGTIKSTNGNAVHLTANSRAEFNLGEYDATDDQHSGEGIVSSETASAISVGSGTTARLNSGTIETRTTAANVYALSGEGRIDVPYIFDDNVSYTIDTMPISWVNINAGAEHLYDLESHTYLRKLQNGSGDNYLLYKEPN